jgi:hypothetical protein
MFVFWCVSKRIRLSRKPSEWTRFVGPIHLIDLPYWTLLHSFANFIKICFIWGMVGKSDFSLESGLLLKVSEKFDQV